MRVTMTTKKGSSMKTSIINFHCHGGKTLINGKVYENISGTMEITDKGVFVNGKPIEEYDAPPVFKIEISGNVETIESECADIEVKGDVKNVNSKNGNISVGHDVLENVESKNGNIHVYGKVMGDVTTKNGNIHY